MIRTILLGLLLLPLYGLADSVVPIDAVENNVNIRMSPDPKSEVVGQLDQGASAVLVESIDGWHKVELEGGSTGFISADWSRVLTDADELAEVTPEPVPTEVESVAAADAVVDERIAEAPAPVAEVAEEAEAVTEPVIESVMEPVDEPVEVSPQAAVEPEEVSTPEPEPVASTPEPSPETEPTAEPEPTPEPAPEPSVADESDRADSKMELKGTKNFLVRFRDRNEGGNSQIYDDGNQVGIGTTTPKQRLEVNGSIQIHEQNSSVAGLMITQSSGDTGYIMHNRASRLTIGAGSQDRITIDRDGNVGIGVSQPEYPLQMASGAHVTAGGVWTNSSSRELKENIAALDAGDALETVMALRPVEFNYRSEPAENYVGFIAEDVPDLVSTHDRSALSTMDIVAVLTRVVQEQQLKIKELERKIAEK